MSIEQPIPSEQPDSDYARLADLAEQLATLIAVSDPEWCRLAKMAEVLAQGLSSRCTTP